MNQALNDKDPVGVVLRRAGRREAPSAAATERVFAATHAAWQAELRNRSRRRHWLAAAASVAIVAIGAGLWFARPVVPTLVAELTRSNGDYSVTRGGALINDRAATVKLLSGDQLHSAHASGLVARAVDGLTVRVGADTRLRWSAINQIELYAGRLYIDSDTAQPTRARLVIGTPTALVQHVGTRFAVQADATRLRVAVRDGVVEVTPRRGGTVRVAGGEVLESSSDGQLRRFKGSGATSDWQWVDDLAPATMIDGRMLYDVLVELAHESGLLLRFESIAVETAARSLALNGRPLELRPRDALVSILAATPFEAQVNRDELTIRARP
jgi:ferric-dicitrate binding protein FerR (iron transport regulator)